MDWIKAFPPPKAQSQRLENCPCGDVTRRGIMIGVFPPESADQVPYRTRRKALSLEFIISSFHDTTKPAARAGFAWGDLSGGTGTCRDAGKTASLQGWRGKLKRRKALALIHSVRTT